ncbi:MAG TPA: DUF481 domain-containing protein [Polyangiaceae bacterium]|nr:DUF481 domain-containing protein [Polyangiaceae bacterium]
MRVRSLVTCVALLGLTSGVAHSRPIAQVGPSVPTAPADPEPENPSPAPAPNAPSQPEAPSPPAPPATPATPGDPAPTTPDASPTVQASDAPASAAPSDAATPAPAPPASNEITEISDAATKACVTQAVAAPPTPPCPPAPVGAPRVDTTVLDPTESDGEADWIQLASGEWLQGTLERMREGSLDFTSTTLGKLTVAWDSVTVLRSRRRMIFVRSNRTTVTGTAHLANGLLVVRTDSGTRIVDKAEILSIVKAKTNELSRWAFLVTLGLAGRTGNTETLNYTAYSRMSRVDAFNRMVAEYTGAFGRASGVDNTNKHRGTASWDLFVSPIIYVTPISGELVYDQFQNLGLRWSAASGFGARALRLASLTLKTELATGFLQNNYVTVAAGEPAQTQGAFVRPGLQVNGALAPTLGYELQWQSSIVVTEPAFTYHHGAARLSFALFGKATADLMAVYDRQETTVTGADGVTPKRDDLSLSLGFGIDLH